MDDQIPMRVDGQNLRDAFILERRRSLGPMEPSSKFELVNDTSGTATEHCQDWALSFRVLGVKLNA